MNRGLIPHSGDSAFKRTIAPVALDIFEVAVHFGRAPSPAHIFGGTIVVCHAFVGKGEYTGLSLRCTTWVLWGKNTPEVIIVTISWLILLTTSGQG